MKPVDLSVHDALEECLEYLPRNNTHICLGEIYTGDVEPTAVVVIATGDKLKELRAWMIEKGYLEAEE